MEALEQAYVSLLLGTGLVILLSILLHGVSVTPAMAWLDRRRDRTA